LNVLVTGGGGFLGKALCRKLVERGDRVRSLSRADYPELREMGVETFRADLSDPKLLEAVRGCDAVYHAAAKAGLWGPHAEFFRANVSGTASVIDACLVEGVPKLIYTSSPSVVFGASGQEGVDESLGYPESFLASYPETKAEAEQLALAANSERLAVVALRPHLIWGPGDNHLLPRLVARARAGKLRFVGPSKKIDTVYIDNAVQAHLDALDHLDFGAACAGKAYFISQGQPIALDEMINRLLKATGLPAEHRRISLKTAMVAGFLFEQWYRLTNNRNDPPMTRFLAEQLSTAHWFNISAARRDLGYQPKTSLTEGLVRLSEWWMREGKAQYAKG